MVAASYPREAGSATYESIKGRNAPGSRAQRCGPTANVEVKHENSPSRILPARIMRSEKPSVPAAVCRWRPPTPHNNVLRILQDRYAAGLAFPTNKPLRFQTGR